MQISQIYISSQSSPPTGLLKSFSDSVANCFPGIRHVVYDNEMIEELIISYYGKKYINAYRKLRPFAYKSDLARYCIVNIFGGWYIDMGFKWLENVSVGSNVGLVAFRDIPRFSRSSWACAGGAFFARAGYPALSIAIDLIVKNIEQDYYGFTPLCPTGPTVWGRAIASLGLRQDIVFGDFLELTPTHSKKNAALVLPDGTVCALRKPSDDLAELGGAGTNLYWEFWRNKQVYEPLSLPEDKIVVNVGRECEAGASELPDVPFLANERQGQPLLLSDQTKSETILEQELIQIRPSWHTLSSTEDLNRWSRVHPRFLNHPGCIVDLGCLGWNRDFLDKTSDNWAGYFFGKKRVIGVDPQEKPNPNAELFNGFISNYCGRADLVSSGVGASLRKSPNGRHEVLTWHAFLRKFGIQSISVLKINIEGSEWDLLDSFNTDDFKCIDQICVSFHDFLHSFSHCKPRTEACINKIATAGYDMVDLGIYGWRLFVRC